MPHQLLGLQNNQAVSRLANLLDSQHDSHLQLHLVLQRPDLPRTQLHSLQDNQVCNQLDNLQVSLLHNQVDNLLGNQPQSQPSDHLNNQARNLPHSQHLNHLASQVCSQADSLLHNLQPYRHSL
jgi:hypothetical protein